MIQIQINNEIFIGDSFVINVGPPTETFRILAETGDVLTTESADALRKEQNS
jgi:hypothetical protein